MEGLSQDGLYQIALTHSVYRCNYKCTDFCSIDEPTTEHYSQGIGSEALDQSRAILARFNHPKRDDSGAANPILSACFFCKKLIPYVSEAQCKHCCERFCIKHKLQMNHRCDKLPRDENAERYQNAKNQFKLRLKEVKNKAAR
jgi:hypothetical protein